MIHLIDIPTEATVATMPVQRQAAIENALSMALWHVRQSKNTSIQAATAKAIRAVSMLKQACADSEVAHG